MSFSEAAFRMIAIAAIVHSTWNLARSMRGLRRRNRVVVPRLNRRSLMPNWRDR